MTAEKLHDIAMLTLPQGKVNLHWLITGEGDPFLQVAEKENAVNMKTKDMSLSDEGGFNHSSNKYLTASQPAFGQELGN